MQYQFIDYDPISHRALDHWRSEAIAEFAMDSTISEEWQYYIDAPEYQVGVNAFCKVALLDNQPIAVMILLCGHPDYPANINPIIVDPARTGQSHGSAIVRQLVENMNERFNVVINNDNAAAIKVFAKAGFTRVGEHPDGDVAYYERAMS